MRRLRVGCAVLAATAMMLGDATAAEAQGRGRNALHVPPGHMPAPGECRVWYVGRPPGHQPPAVPCGYLRGYRFPGAVVIGTPVHRGPRHFWDVRDGRRLRLMFEWRPERVRASLVDGDVFIDLDLDRERRPSPRPRRGRRR